MVLKLFTFYFMIIEKIRLNKGIETYVQGAINKL